MKKTGEEAVQGALNGIRVLDSSQMFAGPLCGMRLGDLGADVLKIEPPGNGEWNRWHSMADAHMAGITTTFLSLNRNKRSVALNLKNPTGLEAFYGLVKTADVFLENFRVGTADRIGIGYEHLSSINPRLVYCSISGYGREGPGSQRPGQDLLLQAFSGSMWAVGSKSDPPTSGALWAADAMTGISAAVGILAALIARERTGKGQRIEVSMLETVMDCQVQELFTYLNLGIQPVRTGERSAHAWIPAPYDAFQTADGWITLAMPSLPNLGECLGSDRLKEFTEWSDGITHRDEVHAIVRSITPSKTTQEWLDLLLAHKIWAGPVNTYKEMLEDPQVAANDMVVEYEHPTAGRVRTPNVPIRLSETPSSIRRPPPLLGQHTEEVLTELPGYDDARLRAMRDQGAI